MSPIHFAAANDKLDDVQSLVAADVKIVESKDEKQVRTPLDNVIHSDCDASYLFQLYIHCKNKSVVLTAELLP